MLRKSIDHYFDVEFSEHRCIASFNAPYKEISRADLLKNIVGIDAKLRNVDVNIYDHIFKRNLFFIL